MRNAASAVRAQAALTRETGALVIDTDAARELAGMDPGPDDDTRREQAV